MPTLYTSGDQGARQDAFIQRLRAHGVTLWVDVRHAARSGKKGLSKRALAAAFHDAGIGYAHGRHGWRAR
jgi:uncharacterized protein (DUF488 family)